MAKRKVARANKQAEPEAANLTNAAPSEAPLPVEPPSIDLTPAQPITLPEAPEMPLVDSPPLQPEAKAAAASAGARPQAAPEAATAAALPVPAFVREDRTAAGQRATAAPRGVISALHSRAKRFLPLAASLLLATTFGAAGGSFAALYLVRSDADRATVSAGLNDTVARLSADLAALRANVAETSRTAGAQVARIAERLDRSERAQADSAAKLAKLSDAATRLEQRTSALASGDITGSIPDPRPAAPTEAKRTAKATVLQGWVVRSVYDGAALLQGRIGLVEVEPGDTLPGLGRVETIKRQDGRWTVVTSRGLIVGR
ncbi:MAG TPA: hypothetical protein VHA77_18670 [Xanthobacteraceae bacterium]|nr:hypothetical protein [Xanthobacteraceae bacterium]